MSLRHRLAPSLRARAWGEAVAIPVAAIGAAFAVRPDDPFLLNASFPWLWLAPVLVALRYGLAPAVLSLGTLILSFVAARLGLPQLHLHHLPQGQFLGGVVLTLLSGEYGSTWILRLRRAEQMSRYAMQQLESLTRTLHATRISHDRLEQTIIGKPVTLRDSLLDLRRTLAATGGALTEALAARLLQLTAYHGGFEQAALYTISNGVIDGSPRASIGPAFALEHDDILVARCLEKQRTAYWAANSLKDGEQSAYLVAAPIHASDGVMLGLLVVVSMPFLFLNDENLLTVSVLLAYFADDAYATHAAQEMLAALPHCPPRFAAETIKLSRAARELGLESSLVTIAINEGPLRDQIIDNLTRLARGLDDNWRIREPGAYRLVTLIPFGNRSVAEGYAERVSAYLEERFGIKPGPATFSVTLREFGSADACTLLRLAAGPSHDA